MNYDYELEKHYHPENFERNIDEEEVEIDEEVRVISYIIEVRNVILEEVRL